MLRPTIIVQGRMILPIRVDQLNFDCAPENFFNIFLIVSSSAIGAVYEDFRLVLAGTSLLGIVLIIKSIEHQVPVRKEFPIVIFVSIVKVRWIFLFKVRLIQGCQEVQLRRSDDAVKSVASIKNF